MTDRLHRLIAVLVGWLTLADHALPDLTPDPVTTTGPPVDLTLYCEGDIGSGGDFGGGGSGGGGGGSSGPSLPTWIFDLEPLKNYVGTLVSFASNPLRFLRGRAIPPILGAIFGFTFDLANIISRPFEAVLGSFNLASASVSTATQAVTQPIGDVVSSGSATIVWISAPFGPLQPFVAAALVIVSAYGLVIFGIRLARAIADAIPIVSGVETFLFG